MNQVVTHRYYLQSILYRFTTMIAKLHTFMLLTKKIIKPSKGNETHKQILRVNKIKTKDNNMHKILESTTNHNNIIYG